MEKSHSMQRAEELRILIATVKIKHKLTNAQLAKKIGVPLSTFTYWKSHIEKFPVGKIWLIEVLADK
jgi:DNA-binding XRE family transcriptional regulator